MITAVSVLVGAWIGYPKNLDMSIVLAMITGFLTCGYGNIVNDLHDIEIDAINAPHRPLPKGTVKKQYVIYEAILLAALGLILAFLLGQKAFVLVSTALILLLLYAFYLKTRWSANLVVALLTGFSFLLGGVVNNNIGSLFPFIFSFFIHMPREITKDLIDETGDRSTGIITMASKLGAQKAKTLASIFLALLCLIMPLPFILQTLTWKYMVAILVLVYPLIIYIMTRMLRRPGIADLRSLSRLFKIAMITGLIAMII